MNSAIRSSRALGLTSVNVVSTLSQTVQLGALPTLLSLTLEARGVDSAMIGVFSTAPWLAILVFSRFVPLLISRWGLLWSVLLSVMISTGAVLLIGLSDQLLLIYILNVLVGIGLIIRWIACDTWIVTIASQEARGRAIGIHETAMGMGIAAGPFILSLCGIDGVYPFLTCAAVLLLSLPWLLLLRPWNDQDTFKEKREPLAFSRLFSLMPMALAGAFCAGFIETSSVSLLAIYSTRLGYHTTLAVLMVGALGLGGMLLQMPIGWFADRFGIRRGHLLCSSAVLLGAISIPLVMSSSWLVAVLLFLWGGMAGGMNTLAVLEAGAAVSERDTAKAMTTVAFSYTLGGLLGPVISGAFMQYVSPHGLMIVVGLVSFLFALTYTARWVLRVPEPS